MKTLLLTLHAQTPIHAGSGQADSVVDLPIQRESHTSYPCVFGSAMKGALKAHCELRADKQNINELFGQEGDLDNGNAGAVMISDARLLLLPIRTLTGQFRWVTCPQILARLKADSLRFAKAISFELPQVSEGEVLTPTAEETLYLEEYRFKGNGNISDEWLKELAQFITYDNNNIKLLEKQLAVISDEDFAYLAKYALPVNPHITIDTATKQVKQGQLWYEETLPADTVLYSGIAIEQARVKESLSEEEVAVSFKQLFAKNQWLQIGGNETVGMGWCSVNMLEG